MCRESNTKGLPDKRPDRKYREMVNLVMDRKLLFLELVDEQGGSSYKGGDYLITAFYFANIQKCVVIEKLDALAASIALDLEYQMEIIKGIPAIEFNNKGPFRTFVTNSRKNAEWMESSPHRLAGHPIQGVRYSWVAVPVIRCLD